MSAQHTPGPWAEGDCQNDWSADNDGENTWTEIVAAGRPDPICLVVEGAAWGRDDILDANARLIAAAPELLEALQAMTHGLPDLLESIGYSDEEDMIGKALAAIAKATGAALARDQGQ